MCPANCHRVLQCYCHCRRLRNALYICLHHTCSPHLSPISDSVRNFPITSGSVMAEKFGCRFRFGIGFRLSLRLCCQFCLRLGRSLWFAFRRRLCLAFSERFLHGVRLCFPSSSRSSMLFSPPVGFALVCLRLAMFLSACCWLCSCLPICWLCSFGSFDFSLLLGVLFSRPSYPCCFLKSSHHWLWPWFLSPLALWLWFAYVTSNTTAQLKPLRDCGFAVGALVPRIRSLQQRVLLTMRIGFFFVRYFFT